MGILLKLAGDALQAFGDFSLFFLQSLNCALAILGRLLRRLPGFGAAGGVLDQTGKGALLFECLTQQRRVFALALLRCAEGDFCCVEVLRQLRLAFAECRVLLGVCGNLRRQWRQQRIKLGLARELMALRAKLFQTRQFYPLAGQCLPLLLRGLQLFAGGFLRVLQLTQILQPTVLLLKLFELRLLRLHLLLRGVETLVEFGARFRRQRRHTGGLILQLLVRFTGFFGLVEGAAAEAGVQRGVGEFFQQFTAVVIVSLEERTELTLRQQHSASELFKVQAQRGFQLGFVFAFLAGEQLILIDVAQALPTGLELAASLLASTIGFPARAIAAPIDADKIHFGIAFTGAASQQGARVASGDFTVSIGDFRIAAGVVQTRYGAEQCQAQGVEQGAFAGACGAGDCEQAGAGQRFSGEIDLERPGQRGEVLQTNGENFHGCSPSSCTSCSSSAKSLSVCSSTSLP